MIPTEFKIIAAGLAFLAVFGGGWLSRGWLAERDQALAVAAAEAQASAAYEAEIKAGRQALENRERKIVEIAAANRGLHERLTEEYAKNPETRAWADALMPAAVSGLFR